MAVIDSSHDAIMTMTFSTHIEIHLIFYHKCEQNIKQTNLVK